MLELPSLPITIPILNSDDSERIDRLYPSGHSVKNCVTCRGNEQFQWIDAEGKSAAWMCNCEEQYILHRYLLSAGIDLNYQRLGWNDALAVNSDAVEVIQDYIEHCDAYVNSGLGLVLWGSMGNGKTLLSTLLMKSLLARGVKGYFASFSTVLDLFTNGWDQNADKRWFDQRIRHAGVLVIDDIGREYEGRRIAESTLDHVLRSRVAGDRPTIITSNRSPDEMRTLYSGNALSLLAESAIVHEFRGADYRSTHRDRKLREARAKLTRPIVLA